MDWYKVHLRSSSPVLKIQSFSLLAPLTKPSMDIDIYTQLSKFVITHYAVAIPYFILLYTSCFISLICTTG